MAFPVHYLHDDATDAEVRFASDDNGLLEGGSDLPHFSEERLFPLRLPTIREPSKPHIAKGRRERAQAVQADFVFKRAKQDCYTPYQDYLGLCHELEYGEGCGRSELSPSSDISLSSDDTSDSASLGLVRFAVGTSRFDQLDRERLAAMSEFARNGTTFDLDDYDIIQQKVRGHEPPTREIPVVPNDRLKEFLWHKQSKIAANSVPDALTSQFKKKSKLICVFCKNNKEPQHVYTGHVLKDWRGFTVCPVLRKYPCPICQAIGDHAHTIKYCPFNNDSEFRTSPSPLRTSRMATGKKRRT